MSKNRTENWNLQSLKESFSKELDYQWNLNILAVDEDSSVLESYKEIFTKGAWKSLNPHRTSKWEDLHIHLDCAITPKEALTKIESLQKHGQSYAMVFLDVQFQQDPEAGVVLAQKILNQSPETFLVFVTSSKDKQVEDIGEALGEDEMDQWDFISKPFLRGEILQKARNYLSLWNHKKEKQIQSRRWRELQDQLTQVDLTTSLAAVARGTNHEFSNILMQIIGKAELSLRRQTEDLKPAMEQILEACFRARDILERFRNLTDSRKMDSSFEKVNLTEVLEWTLGMMERQIEESNVQIFILGEQELFTWGNSTALMQVILNLLINALDAMPSGGDLEIHGQKSEGHIELCIRDHGTGIHEEHLEKIFEPLFTTKGSAGTGLGLPICKEIIEREHGGDLRLKNHPEGGVEITLELPIYKEQKKRNRTKKAA